MKTLQACGAEFVYAHEMADDFDYLADPWVRRDDESSIRKFSRYILGSALVDRVVCVRMIEKSNFARIRPLNNDRKPHQTEAWIALRTLNQMSPLRAVAVEVNTPDQLEILSKFDRLKYLQVICYTHDSMEDLGRLPNLEALEVATRSSDIDWMAELSQVTTLHVRKVLPAPRLTIDLGFLSKMPQLESLELRAVQVRNVTSVADLTKLKRLGFVYTDLESAEPLAGLDLQELSLTDSSISSTSGLDGFPRLQILDISGTEILKSDVDRLKQTLGSHSSPCQIFGSGVTPESE